LHKITCDLHNQLVFGFLDDSFAAEEAGTEEYDLPVGFRSGTISTGVRLRVTATPGTAGKLIHLGIMSK